VTRRPPASPRSTLVCAGRNRMKNIRVIDSHTGGEPTRVVISGGPELGTGSLAERRERFARDCNKFRNAVVNEPRGSDAAG
jgi:4-hydroxyproline epimerase